MNKSRILTLILVIVFASLGYGLYLSQTKPNSWFARFPFVLGLDLNGGTELVYRADVSQVGPNEINDSMKVLRDVIERRVNIFGVSEPVIQVEKASALAGRNEHRLIVELPGVTEIDKAIELIGKTPLLEFMLVSEEKPKMQKAKVGSDGVVEIDAASNFEPVFIPTALTGRFLERSAVEFNQTTGEPSVSLSFNKDGAE